ncbi:MAG: flavin-dependent oxidoreductase [Pseudomonadota bacterium]
MKIAIAGGGIGGLTLALALHRVGLSPVVFEQAPQIREVGVGINTLPHAIRELADLGLLKALDSIAIRTKTLVYKTATGQNIVSQPRGTWAGYDVPQFSIHRGMLQRVLADAVVERLGSDAIKTGHRLNAFSQTADAVALSVTPEDRVEQTYAFDALVGADGIHSVVRCHFSQNEGPPRWSGIVMWRGATWVPPFGDGQTMIIAGGLDTKLVLYPIHNAPQRPGETLMNWVICARVGEDGAPLDLADDWTRRARADDVMPYVAGKIAIDEIDVAALIRQTEQIYVYPMADRDPLERWTDRRVTLMGDAAHPMYPVGSNGASQAILDAIALARHVEADGIAGLEAYDCERRPATSEIVVMNRKGGPERIIDLVEARAPDGFDDLDAIASRDEIEAIVGGYQKLAGFSVEQVNA